MFRKQQKRMRKMSSAALPVFLFVLSLAGCGQSGVVFTAGAGPEADAGDTGDDGMQEEPAVMDGTAEESPDREEASAAGTGEIPAEAEDASEIYVDVEGAVLSPGVYILQQGDRVFQAVDAAGGFTADAAPRVLNQALSLSDGMQIYVPTEEEIMADQTAAAAPTTDQAALTGFSESGADAAYGQAQADQAGDTGLININTADAAGLETLNGIGPARAQAIIDYRRTVSAFTAIEDIKKVSGIGNGIFSRIRDHITV